jgi:hypothetical protein
MEKADIIVVKKSESRENRLANISNDMSIILKWILKNWDMRMFLSFHIILMVIITVVLIAN